jgi:ABC-type lipoprotein release transport system permease subunit
MKWSLIFEISKALMFARMKQTLIAATGVMFSITMFVALLGFMNGLNTMLDGLVLNRTPHIRFYNEIRPNPNQPIDQSSQFEKAQERFEKLIKLEPFNPEYYFYLGEVYAKSGNVAKAIKTYETCKTLVTDKEAKKEIDQIINKLNKL